MFSFRSPMDAAGESVDLGLLLKGAFHEAVRGVKEAWADHSLANPVQPMTMIMGAFGGLGGLVLGGPLGAFAGAAGGASIPTVLAAGVSGVRAVEDYMINPAQLEWDYG